MPQPIDPIEFYFDFSSPYGYLASEKIDEIAERFGREVRWHPALQTTAGRKARWSVSLRW